MGTSTFTVTPDFGESFYYSPRPLAVGERIFTAYGAALWGSDDRGRGWTELPSPSPPTDPPQSKLVFPLSDGGLLTVFKVIPDDDLSSTPHARVWRAGTGDWVSAPTMLSAGIQSVTAALPLSGGGAALVGSPYHPTSEAEADVEVVVRFDGEGVGPPIALPFNMGGLWRKLIALQGGEPVFLVPEHEPGKPAPTFSTLVGATKAKPVALPSGEHAAQFASVALADGRLLLTGGPINGAPTVET